MSKLKLRRPAPHAEVRIDHAAPPVRAEDLDGALAGLLLALGRLEVLEDRPGCDPRDGTLSELPALAGDGARPPRAPSK
jgi:hypothetical protein